MMARYKLLQINGGRNKHVSMVNEQPKETLPQTQNIFLQMNELRDREEQKQKKKKMRGRRNNEIQMDASTRIRIRDKSQKNKA